MHWSLYLVIAIITEVLGTSALKMSDGFTRPIPLVIMVACFAIAFFSLSIVMRSIPVGLIYAMWSGLGIVLISLIGRFIFNQPIDTAGLVGISLIVAGVVVIGVFSNSLNSGS
jgi:small multidrug resistance pump